MKFGIDLQSVRMAFLRRPASRRIYDYTGLLHGDLNQASPVTSCSFLANQVNSGQLSNGG